MSSYAGVLTLIPGRVMGWNIEFPYTFLDQTADGSPHPFQIFHSCRNTSEFPVSFTMTKGIFV